MKKFSYFTGALSALLIGISASAAANSYVPNCCADTCEWSFCDGKFMVEADWLYWQTEQTNMNVVHVTDIIGFPDDATTKDVTLDRNYENGYRVGVGYQVPSNDWEFKVVYTNMPTHATGSANYPTANDIVSTGISFSYSDSGIAGPGHVDIKWDGNINNIDVDVGRTLSLGECFRLHPHIGFRALWADQKYKARVVGVLDDVPYDFLAIDAKEKFNSYGVEAGLGASWNVGYGFSLLGHFGGSLLYTNFDLNSKYAVSNGTTPPFTHKKDKLSLGTPTLDYFLGLAYTSTFCETELDIYAGWEQHVLFDVNQLILGSNSKSGDWYTQGLTLGLRAAF